MVPVLSIEIYGPNAGRTPLAVFHPPTLTFAFNRGDLLHPGWFGDFVSDNPGKMLRIINVEHILWAEKPGEPHGMKHKVCLYTEAVEDLETTRTRAGGR